VVTLSFRTKFTQKNCELLKEHRNLPRSLSNTIFRHNFFFRNPAITIGIVISDTIRRNRRTNILLFYQIMALEVSRPCSFGALNFEYRSVDWVFGDEVGDWYIIQQASPSWLHSPWVHTKMNFGCVDLPVCLCWVSKLSVHQHGVTWNEKREALSDDFKTWTHQSAKRKQSYLNGWSRRRRSKSSESLLDHLGLSFKDFEPQLEP
jgi:hypothetical protein